MKFTRILFSRVVAFATMFSAVVAATFSFADPGHDHGNEVAKVGAIASPRFEAHSDLFELVGVYETNGVTIYLDRYRSNEPVIDAKLEYEVAGVKGIATPQPDGTYRIENEGVTKAKGAIAFAFTITQGNDADLLAVDFVPLQARASGEGHTHEGEHGHLRVPIWTYIAIFLLFVGLGAVILFFARARKTTSRPI